MSKSDIQAFHNRPAPLLLALGFFILLSGSAVVALLDSTPLTEAFFAELAALMICALIVVAVAGRLRDPAPQVAFSDDGVYSKMGGGEWIPWDRIGAIGFMEKKRPPLAPKRPRLVILVGTTGIQEEVVYREGGLPEIAAAIDRFLPRDTDPDRAAAWTDNKRQWALA